MTYPTLYADGFGGRIARTARESKPWWPASVVPDGAPEVVAVVRQKTSRGEIKAVMRTALARQ